MSGRADVVAAAQAWLGTPYRHQGSCRGAGADCLGLVRGVWREIVGDEPAFLPPYTRDWDEVRRDEVLWAGLSRYLEPADADGAVPGDVLLFRMRKDGIAKHLGILTRSGAEARFIHAYARHGVIENALSGPWRRRIVAAFRFPERSL